MVIRVRWLVRVMLGGALIVASHGAESAGDDRQAQVAAAERGFAASMAARDFTAFGAFVADEAIFFSNQKVLRGKAAVLAGWQGFFAGPEAPFSWEPDTVEVLDSGTLALSSGPVYDPTGKVVARFNSVWRLEPDGKWRVVFDKGERVCPPPVERQP